VAVSPDGSKVYVANGFSNTVSVIATTTNTVIDTVPVENLPHFLAVTTDGRRVYVGNSNSNTVSVIDTASDAVIATIPVGSNNPSAGGSYPQGVATSPDGSRVYVANSYLANSVSVISTESNTVVATIPVGVQPEGSAVTADGSKLYVANANYDMPGTVSVASTATNTVVATVPVGVNPLALGIFIQRPLGFAGIPGKNNCYGQSVSALTTQYHRLNAAAAALGYSSAKALQNTILAFCEA
jgi:YVTN family beta-propeller protein